VRIRRVLQERDALNYTCLIFTAADDLAALQFLAPFAGCTVGEWFMNNGYNAAVIYDDLSQHAVAYRQMSLLLRNPPSREAYPGDVFFLHARLLERSAQLVKGGSLTALPIVQTLSGDISGYIPTNVISITDGQIFLVKSLFNQGIRPAVDISLSVSRVGSAAQFSPMSFVSKRIKGVYSLYRLFSGVAKLGSDDQDVLLHVHRGDRLLNLFTQPIYETYSLYKQLICLYALTVEFTDVVVPARTKLFFSLFSLKNLSYLLELEARFVAYFIDTVMLESLLIVFSMEMVVGDLTCLLRSFSLFYKLEVSGMASTSELDHVISKLDSASNNRV
jgi:F-type H+-transporting ATPase subunit alpha